MRGLTLDKIRKGF